ncbi:MAG: hypothetical protein KGI37_07575 [Alphaproteobacteria bacterium]|nr:hypothetical protein [Alphaproteobacteria bacterium]
MSIEQQVAQLVADVADIKASLATPPQATVDLSSVTAAIAALDTKVSTILADITDPDDAAANATGTPSSTSTDTPSTASTEAASTGTAAAAS